MGSIPTGAGATLEVKGSDPLTDNVSWYQNAFGAITWLRGNLRLQADAGYTQNEGNLVTVAGSGNDSNSCYLYGGTGGGGNWGTININNGGTVRFTSQGILPLYASLYMQANNVNVEGEIEVRIAGQNPPSADQIVVNNSMGTMTFQPGAKIVVNVVGKLKTQQTWGSVVTAKGGLVDTNNLQTSQTNDTNVNVNSPNITVTS